MSDELLSQKVVLVVVSFFFSDPVNVSANLTEPNIPMTRFYPFIYNIKIIYTKKISSLNDFIISLNVSSHSLDEKHCIPSLLSFSFKPQFRVRGERQMMKLEQKIGISWKLLEMDMDGVNDNLRICFVISK